MEAPLASRFVRGYLLLALFFLWMQVPAQPQEAETEDTSASDQEEGQEERSVPVLVSGPSPGRELPFLPPNAIEYHSGLYELPEQYLLLYHTNREIVPPSSW
ncbi:MAG: hypothetical protein R6V67_01735, partial [Spirochaetia bacterium]